MSSSSRRRLLGLALVAALTAPAARAAAQQAQGFALDRFSPSPAGAGWFVMDDLDMWGGLGGALALTLGYARDPLRLEDGFQSLAVVSSEALGDFGFAATYDRWRVYLDLRLPLYLAGESGTIGGAMYAAPHLTLGSNPDTLADPRLGVEGRLYGAPGGPLRLGLSAELIAPNGERSDYDTDKTFRGMIRALVAGDLGRYRYAGQLGVHIRPLDEASVPGSPQGSELLFGGAAGATLGDLRDGALTVILGPELYGATAFHSPFGGTTTALEGLLAARLEGTAPRGRQLRLRVGAGGGLHQDFGAPEWRVLVSVETFNRDGGRPRF
ncbi:MAG TPA: hypothetical protein VHO06_11100 [Polyangia bacterium]|nr:hypothetical protein [Polyangia bacterium]